MHGTVAGVIQSGRNGIRFQNLSVLILHDLGFGTMNDAQPAQLDGSGRQSRFHSLSSGFS